MLYITPGAAFEAAVQGFPTGLVGTVGVRILDNIGGTPVARTTAGIIEAPTGSGFYSAPLVAPSVAGQFTVFWDQGGALDPAKTAAEDLIVTPVPSPLAGPSGSDLCTLADVRSFMKWKATYTAEDGEAQNSIAEASATIMDALERELAPVTASEARTLRLDPTRRINGSVLLDLSPYDLRTVSLFRLDPEGSSPATLVAGTDYVLSPVDTPQGVYTSVRLKNSLSYSSTLWQNLGYAQVEITGAWGFASVPAAVRRACVETVGSWLRRDASAFDIPDIEDPRQTAPNPAQIYSIPPGAWKKLMPYKRNGGVF